MNIKCNKIILHGAFQNENFGDVLLLRIFKNALLERKKNISVYGSNVGEVASAAAAIKRAGFFIKLDRRVPLIFCGGGYLGERSQRKIRWGGNLWLRHLYLGVLSALIGRPYVILATGFGPLSFAWYRKPVVWFMRHAKAVKLRDRESVEFYKSYGGGEVELVADAVLSVNGNELKGFFEDQSEKFFIEKHNGSIKLAVHIPGDQRNKEARRKIAENIKKAVSEVEEKGRKVSVLIFSDNGIGKEHDYFQWFDKEKSEAAAYSNVDDVLSILDSADCVITTKLHVGICSAVFGKRILSFAAHQKTRRFYRQMERPELCSSLDEDDGEILSKVRGLMLGEIKPVIVPDEVRLLAKKSWESFDELSGEKE